MLCLLLFWKEYLKECHQSGEEPLIMWHLYMLNYKNEPAGIEMQLPWSVFIEDHCSGLIDMQNITVEKQLCCSNPWTVLNGKYAWRYVIHRLHSLLLKVGIRWTWIEWSTFISNLVDHQSNLNKEFLSSYSAGKPMLSLHEPHGDTTEHHITIRCLHCQVTFSTCTPQTI